MDIQSLPKSIKAAILINSLGNEASQQIIQLFNDKEKEIIKKNVYELRNLPSEIVEKVAEDFIKNTKNKNLNNYQNKFINNESINENNEIKPYKFESLNNLEISQIIELIKDEHPQTIAFIILNLDFNIASNVLSAFSNELKSEIAIRMARMDKVLEIIVNEVNLLFKEILKNNNKTKIRKTNGLDQLAQILNYSEQIIAEQILLDIEKKYPNLAEEIKQKMFIFDDIVLIDDKGMQKVLRKIESKELALALKGSSNDIKQKILKNMSKRAAEMIIEELDNLGAVRMKDIEISQQNILKIIQEMVSSNEIIINGRGGEKIIA